MTVQKETPVDDAELDALMAELENETAAVVAPPAAAAAAPTPAPEPVAEVAPAPAPAAAPASASVDDELDALAKELESNPPWNESPATAVAPAAKPADQDNKTVASAAQRFTEPPSADPIPAAPAAAPEPEAKAAPMTPAEAIPMPAVTQPKKAGAALQLQHYVDMDQFKADISVSEARLDNCMMEQSALRATHGYLAANAEAQHSRLKLRFDVVEASLYDTHRKAILDSGEKATEKMVENAVRKDERWVKAKNAVIEAELIVNVNKACVEALKDRRDMIIQLGADRREEGKGQARIMAAESANRSVNERAAAAAAAARA